MAWLSWNRDPTRLPGVLVLTMAASSLCEEPAIIYEKSDDLANLHLSP